jgi:hypothetical protein
MREVPSSEPVLSLSMQLTIQPRCCFVQQNMVRHTSVVVAFALMLLQPSAAGVVVAWMSPGTCPRHNSVLQPRVRWKWPLAPVETPHYRRVVVRQAGQGDPDFGSDRGLPSDPAQVCGACPREKYICPEEGGLCSRGIGLVRVLYYDGRLWRRWRKN